MTPAAWPRLCLGCGNFGGIGSAPELFGQGTSAEDADAIMDAAYARGIRWFDTADAYGGGASERFIGHWRARTAPDDLLITTKVGNAVGVTDDRGLSPTRVVRAAEASIERLGVDRIDLYLAHEPDPDTPIGATVEAFETLRERGLVAAWGLSNYDAAGIEQALAYGRPALVQNSYSLLERGDERDVLPLCAREQIAYVPFGPLAGGWLAGRYRRDADYPAGSRMTLRPDPYLHLAADHVYDGLDLLAAEAEGRGTSVATLAFAWVLSHPDIAGAVCGPSRPEHLDPVLAALDLALDAGERHRIGSFFVTDDAPVR